jgi:hypothetical protein
MLQVLVNAQADCIDPCHSPGSGEQPDAAGVTHVFTLLLFPIAAE